MQRSAWARALATAVLVASCSRDDGGANRAASGESTAVLDSMAQARSKDRARATHAVQVGSFADSTRALALRDSLAQAGWTTHAVRAEVAGERRWRVVVAPSTDSGYARLVMASLRAQRHAALITADPMGDDVLSAGVRVVHVNYGTHGMAAQTRWAVSEDGRDLLVVEDPTAVEAEPITNGFVYASERTGAWLQMDGVWDVNPSPDWRRLAYGKGYRVGNGEAEVPASRWTALAQQIGPHVARPLLGERGVGTAAFAQALRAHRFNASGMAILYGVGISFVLSTDSLRALPGDAPHRVSGAAVTGAPVMLEGWRTRWTHAGDTLGVGAGPQGSQDFSPPRTWVLVRPRAGGGADSLGTTLDSARFAPVSWIAGPTLDISVPVELSRPIPLRPGRARVLSDNGWILVQRPGERTARVIGPGFPLTATRDGRFIAALATRSEKAEYESPVILVVYQVN